METIKLDNAKLVARSGDRKLYEKLWRNPDKTVGNVFNVLSYGILRTYEEAEYEDFQIDDFQMYAYNSYPHCVMQKGGKVIVNKLHDLPVERKNQMDMMELGAGYDVYELTHNDISYHLYVATEEISNELIKGGPTGYSGIIPHKIDHGDYLKYHNEKTSGKWKFKFDKEYAKEYNLKRWREYDATRKTRKTRNNRKNNEKKG
jgi:hypothetical protein